LITPDWDDTDKLVEISEQALQGGAALLQYRHKTASNTLRRKQAVTLRDLCRRYHCPFIINDHVDLCLELNADGVHVGGADASVKEVRSAIGPDKIVGASCYGALQLARRASQQGASYIAFGGFYPSRIKQYPVTTAYNIVAESRLDIALPIVVIGGMTVDNCAPLIAEGADMVAAISSVYFAENPKLAAREFSDLFL
ncbi:MAG: Thiamin-phosphate pyrophosphorylase, partial [Solimicrobium sp.]|nr:Thiamin-phosphate pyrophosphorylase [Solimicrobium sp.]